MIQCGAEICRNLDAALSREWIETNGLGGVASSTIVGLNTRRHHGLLIAAMQPPVGRLLLLAKLEETLVVDGRRFELSANRYPGVVHPQGFQYLKRFRLDPFPVFTYAIDGVEVEKSVFMLHGENATVIQYRLVGRYDATPHLEVRALIAFRDYHSLTHENGALDSHVQIDRGSVTVSPYAGLPALHVAHNATEARAVGDWYHHFEYDVERERGLDYVEDLFCPFALTFHLRHGAHAVVLASTERHDIRRVPAYRQVEIERRQTLQAALPVDDALVNTLVAAADQFIVARGDQQTIIAGYPWFSDWGRDTMIALPGLTLVLGRADVAKRILLTFARYLDRGMLPNRFPDVGEAPAYNTVDATLWLFEAVRALLHYTADYDFVHEHLYEALVESIAWHQRGTRYGIRVDSDGLLAAGEAGVQLTWMDAKVGDWVVTPRHGKPVEIQALWYNALGIMEHLARWFGDEPRARSYHDMAAQAHRSFNALFWNEEAQCLYDVVAGETCDAAIRPNQIFAVSLPHTMLDGQKASRIVEVVQHRLLTPYGLRSLAPTDPQYRGRYAGTLWERDAAYHQGTVWPWLIGPFITAYIKVHDHSRQSRQQAAQWLATLAAHVHEAGLGQISEIFDGEAPHRPRGCIAQAWSVAEVLRAAIEDVHSITPAKRRAPLAGRSSDHA